MKWMIIAVLVLAAQPSFAQTPNIPRDEINECRIKAANMAIKLHPAFQIKTIGLPRPLKAFEDKDEFGKPVHGWRYEGEMNVSVGNMNGRQFYGCVFVNRAKDGWRFSWSGLGHNQF